MFPTLPTFSVVSQPFKRSQLGLFQGKTKQYGNNVPFSKHKTRRTWLPNVQRKRLQSEALGEEVRVKLTTRALRTIKKHGGIDNYVQKSSFKVLGWEGMRLRLQIKERIEQLKAKNSSMSGSRDSSSEASHTRFSSLLSREKIVACPPVLMGNSKTPPTKIDARQERDRIMKALGLDARPNARQTISYLRQWRRNPNPQYPFTLAEP